MDRLFLAQLVGNKTMSITNEKTKIEPSKTDRTLSEEESLLRSSPEREEKEDWTLVKGSKKKLAHADDTAAIRSYKSKLRKARFYLDKTAKSVASQAVRSATEVKNERWANIILANEEERLRDNVSLAAFVKKSIYEPQGKRDRSKDEEKEPSGKRTDYRNQTDRSSKPNSSTPHQQTSKGRKINSGEAGTSASKGIPPPKPSYKKKESDPRGRSAPTASTKKTSNTKVKITNIDGLAYSEIAKQTLKVSIVDAGSSDLKMSVENFTKVEGGIQVAMYKKMCEDGTKRFPAFKMNERFRGFRIITCDSNSALDFLKEAVASLGEVWKGAKLEVRHLHDLPASPLIKVNLPVSNVDMKMVMGLLMLNNADLPINKWKLAAFGSLSGGRIPVLFRVDPDSVRLLESKNFEIGFCLRTVIVRVLSSNLQEEMNVKDISVEQVESDEVVDISALFNAGLDIDKDPDQEKTDE